MYFLYKLQFYPSFDPSYTLQPPSIFCILLITIPNSNSQKIAFLCIGNDFGQPGVTDPSKLTELLNI